MAKKKGPRWGPLLLNDSPEMMEIVRETFEDFAREVGEDVEFVRQAILRVYRRNMAGSDLEARRWWGNFHGVGDEPTPEELLLAIIELSLLCDETSDTEPSPCEQNTPDAPCTPDRPREDGSR